MSTATATHDEHHDHGPAKGLMRWVTTTNHKDIGTLYLLFALVMFFIGGAMAMVIRAELFQPGLQVVDPQFFNSMTTVHALVMIFGAHSLYHWSHADAVEHDALLAHKSPYLNLPFWALRMVLFLGLWILMLVGTVTGYLAGTIGVGGFIGVPAMIYVFGPAIQSFIDRYFNLLAVTFTALLIAGFILLKYIF